MQALRQKVYGPRLNQLAWEPNDLVRHHNWKLLQRFSKYAITWHQVIKTFGFFECLNIRARVSAWKKQSEVIRPVAFYIKHGKRDDVKSAWFERECSVSEKANWFCAQEETRESTEYCS